MSLDCAILGFLQKAPATGYDIKTRCFSGEIGAFWPADQAQIYRTLKKLEENGEVRVEHQGSTTRPGRNVYSLSPLGKRRFEEWVSSAENPPAIRDPFALKLYFSDVLSKEELMDSYAYQKTELEKRVREIDGWLSEKNMAGRAGKQRALKEVKASLEASIQNCSTELKILSRSTSQGSKR